MSQSIYDDPVVVPQPSSDESRIAELRTFISVEAGLKEQEAESKERCKSIQESIDAKRQEMQKALDRELALLRAQLVSAQSDVNSVSLQLFDIAQAKNELIELSPLTKKLYQLCDKLQSAKCNSNGIPKRPIFIEEIDKFEFGNALIPPQPHLASDKRRDLKRHDMELQEIQEEIKDVRKQMGLLS